MGKSQSALKTELAAIEEILNSGVELVTVDGTTTKYNLEKLSKRAQDLRTQIAAENARRPRAASIYLGGF